MARTTAWEDMEHQARSLPASKDQAWSDVPLDSLLDEIRLLGPSSFMAARNRSLLRHFAVDVAEHNRLMLSAERLHDMIVEFRISNGLDNGVTFKKFLADNDLTLDEFKRLIAIEEKVRWACERAEEDALENLLYELRMRGEYARLAARAANKLRVDGKDKEIEVYGSDEVAIIWYFEQRLGVIVPQDLGEYARSAGFADERALRNAVLREYLYTRASRHTQE